MKRSQITYDFFQNHPFLKNHLELLEHIPNTFGVEDEILILKVPGRINLIGEHVDYNNGPVLPCAIDRETVLCISINFSGNIKIINTQPEYPDVEFSLKRDIKPYQAGHWGNYIKAGVKGIRNYLINAAKKNLNQISGFKAVVSGSLPPAAGLSSSSTLVVGASLAMLKVNAIEMDKLKLAEICAKAEHFVGTAGGGMDHAAILLGEENGFIKLDFNPLRAERIAAPSDLELILFHSLEEAEKSGDVREAYNLRVLECNLILDIFKGYLIDQNIRVKLPLKNLGDINVRFFDLDQHDVDQLIHQFLHSLPESYSLSDLKLILNASVDELDERYKAILRGSSIKDKAEDFKLKQRFKHVYTECQRVDHAVQCLRENDIRELGKLLYSSHQSLSMDYEVSTPAIDVLVELLRKHGAYGARLVGAGFGGMILTLTDKMHAHDLIEKMQQEIYSGKTDIKSENSIIRCKASEGAGFI